MKNFLRILIGTTVIFFSNLTYTHAAEYYVSLIRNYYIDSYDAVRVVETHTIENRSKDRTIKASNVEKFYIHTTTGGATELNKSVDTLKVTVDSTPVDFTKINQNDFVELSVKLPKEIKPGGTMSLKVEYQNYGLLARSGALTDFYAPGYSDDSLSKEISNTRYTVDTYVNISKSLPEVNFTSPKPISEGSESNYKKIYYSYESLVKEYIWVQIGMTQYYEFNIVQKLTSSDSADPNYFDEYKIVVPRDIEEPHIYQKVVFTNLSMEPKLVEEDLDGNLIMTFRVPSTSNDVITIDGFAEVGANDIRIDSQKVGLIDEIDRDSWATSLSAANFWEVDNVQIRTTSAQVIGQIRNIYDISQSLYTYIINKIDYSKIKRFGLNERQGALNTLNGSAAVCMEYSDLFITMSRSVGVPTRAVFGYGYDSKIQNSKQEAHQWAQVYLPGYDSWMSVDVTWGEAGIKMDERNLNHFYTHVSSQEPDVPALVEWKGYGSNPSLRAPEYSIKAVESIPQDSNQYTSKDLLTKYKEQVESNVVSSVLSQFIGDYSMLIKPSSLLVVVGIVMMVVAVFGITKVLRQE